MIPVKEWFNQGMLVSSNSKECEVFGEMKEIFTLSEKWRIIKYLQYDPILSLKTSQSRTIVSDYVCEFREA